MSKYISFWDTKLNGKPGIACGSDSRFYLDGRWNRQTAIQKASIHATKLNKCLNKRYVGLSFGESETMLNLLESD